MHTNIVSIDFGVTFDRIGTTMVFMHGWPIDVVYYIIYDEQLRYILQSMNLPAEVEITLNNEDDIIYIERL